MFFNRYTGALAALFMCMVAVLVAMFTVPNVTPEPRGLAPVMESAPVADLAPEAPDADEAQAEPVYPTTLANAATDRYPASTLWGIAARECGDGKRWKEVMTLNGLAKPEDLQPGIVKLPMDCTLQGPPIQGPSKSTSPALVSKVSKDVATPAPDLKTSEPKGLQAEIEDPPELPSVEHMRTVVMFDCSKTRPTEATPGGKYFDTWLRQCGETYFTGPNVYDNVELFDESGTITRTRASNYQIRQAEELKARLDRAYFLMLRNPDRFTADIEVIKAFYLECDPGIRSINQLSYEEAATALVVVRHIADMYSDSWVKQQRLQGAFLPPFWRQVFSYTVPAKNIAEPEEKPAEALAEGS